jgi:hypothetical protein
LFGIPPFYILNFPFIEDARDSLKIDFLEKMSAGESFEQIGFELALIAKHPLQLLYSY